jgi:RNA polymerase sigma factor (sigma-70 family)
MTFDDLSDEELARRARDGSAACFEEIVRRYQVPLLRFLLRRSPDPVDAEDALQEAFLRAHQSLNKYRDGRPFKPWMFTLTYRLAVSNARKVRPTANDAAINVATSNDGDPSRNLESRESRQLLWDTARRGLGEEQFVAPMAALRRRHADATNRPGHGPIVGMGEDGAAPCEKETGRNCGTRA